MANTHIDLDVRFNGHVSRFAGEYINIYIIIPYILLDDSLVHQRAIPIMNSASRIEQL